jgi:hypothetical protein
MNMKNVLENKKLNDFELDFVAGGTLTQVNELADAFAKKGGTFGEIVGEVHSALSSKTGVVGPLNILLREAVGKGLDQLGISHDLSVGALGTGFMSKANKYSYNGKSISHDEVLKMIGNAKVA